jgi:integrase
VVATEAASLAMLIEYVRKTVTALDKRAEKALLAEPAQDRVEQEERWKRASIELSILSDPADPRRDEWVASTTEKVLADAKVQLSDSELIAQLAEIVRRGLVEVQRRKIARYEDQYGRAVYDHLFDPERPPAVKFAELANMFLVEKEEEYALNGVSRKRADKVQAIVSVLKEIVGAETLVRSIDDDVVQEVRSTVAKMPANRMKFYRNLPLSLAIEKAQKHDKPNLSHLTQASYLDTLRDLLKVAVRKKLLLTNPAAEVRPLKKDAVPRDQKRLPWTPDQISDFFGGKFYHACAPGAVQPYSKRDRVPRFWLPLIMLFSGSRPNEIAQLHIADILCTDAGTWYMNFVDDNGRSLKTKVSRRRVPIHPELIRIGFLEFVELRRASTSKNGPFLFHELGPDKYGNRAKYVAKRLNEVFIPEEIELGERQALYSLRHNVRDALRRIGAPDETLLAVTGWSPSGKAVSSDYGDPGNPDHHIDWVARIAYDGLDVSFLYVPGTPRGVQSSHQSTGSSG